MIILWSSHIFLLCAAVFYLLSCSLHGLLRDIVDLLVQGLISFFSILYLRQQHAKFGASEVHN